MGGARERWDYRSGNKPDGDQNWELKVEFLSV